MNAQISELQVSEDLGAADHHSMLLLQIHSLSAFIAENHGSIENLTKDQRAGLFHTLCELSDEAREGFNSQVMRCAMAGAGLARK
jgi:hypothetical protein